ncbi:MAG TPA: prolyl oligopeptidase family serine peptidase [Verrucomicrobiae bacterium]|nr:prolyl oligopeptidase family serine peptidase [Verrucomicrobiae bacterium]
MCFFSRNRLVLSLILGINFAGVFSNRAQLPAVPTPREPVTNTYHGVAVVDDYQWLESGTNPAVRAWTKAQNERTHAYFDKLDFRDGLEQQLSELVADQSASYGLDSYRRGIIFATRFKPPAQQPVLIRLKSVNPPALRKVVFDPNIWNTNGTTAMDWLTPSPDGRVVAICLSEKGSEVGVLHFFETDTGRALPDIISGVQFPTGGGSAAWNADGTGIFYTRYPHEGERPEGDLDFYQQVWFHKLGMPINADSYELGRDFPRIAEIELTASDDAQWTLATVANGDGGDYAHYLRDASGVWHQLTKFEDGIKVIEFGKDAALYLLSKQDAPRGKILRLPLADLDLSKAAVFVPEGRSVISEYEPSANGLYVAGMIGGPSQLWYYPKAGSPVDVPVLPVSSVEGLHCWQGDELLFSNTSYLVPRGWYQWEPGMKQPSATALKTTSPANFDDIEVVREFAVSKDGTKIPLNILRKKGTKLDGKNPTLLYGYGGYGINLTPEFNPTRRIWFDAGGVYAEANLRGGGEFGEDWHLAGNLTRKQNVFDDFIACAKYLIQRKYTNPDKLAVMGASNGGLLMGAFLTQRPELARAVVSRVGIYDMLRVELDPNGAFNTTEFGSVEDADQFKALFAYSPYHHVKDGTAYPAILFPCGENDGRVNPAHSRKMTARLQAATSSGRPILLRTTATAGHGMGSSLKDRVAEQADIYAFLLQELGVDTSPWTFK